MGVAPTLDNTNGTTITQVASGKTFWGLTSGQWAVQTGTLTSACSVVNVTGYNFGVRVTGDTYITSTVDGEDGELQNGVAWPNPRFTDSCDGTITDNLTGLVWLQDANCFGTTTWATALSSANTLASGACGLTDGSVATDWRLPNVEELASLTHFGFVSPTLPNTAGTGQWTAGDPFDNVSSGYYWSGSQSFYSDGAWSVSMGQGNVVFTFKSVGGSTRVWPVRDGAP
ncbi:MAG: DUF1566 domain-containing protein [Chloroflexi bacterium]|nr:DUF1566 domain-containing protein [Chloroflexota bacterium]